MKRRPLAAVLAVFFAWLLWTVSVRQAALFAVGLGLGALLAGQRFGFTTGWRMLIENKDARGVMGQRLLALATALAMPLLGHFPELTAALGPPSVSLAIGAFVFGLCMQIADGCGSGTLYKAGMGIPMNTAILPLFAIGSFLGSLHLGFWLRPGPRATRGPGQRLGLAAGPDRHAGRAGAGRPGRAWLRRLRQYQAGIRCADGAAKPPGAGGMATSFPGLRLVYLGIAPPYIGP